MGDIYNVESNICVMWVWACLEAQLRKAQGTMYIHCWAILVDRASVGQYESFTQKMVLKGLFLSDIGEDSSCLLFRSPRRQSLWRDSFTQKMVLKRNSLVSQGYIVYIHCSGPLEEKTLMSWYDSFTQKMIQKRPFVSNAGKNYQQAHCSVLLGDRALSQQNSFS